MSLKLIWQDEFDGDALDTTRWSSHIVNLPGALSQRYHNYDYANYIADDDVLVSDGTLKLRAQKRSIQGEDPAWPFEYTAGWITTNGKFSFLYGLVEIRARFPGGAGMWPTFWLMGTDETWGPEFDIAEYFGGEQRLHLGLMYTEYPLITWDSSNFIAPTWTDWHTYALDWRPGAADFLVDGQIYKTIQADYVPAKPMYIILNNGVGSPTGAAGAPDENTIFPNLFEVDYVRVYDNRSK